MLHKVIYCTGWVSANTVTCVCIRIKWDKHLIWLLNISGSVPSGTVRYWCKVSDGTHTLVSSKKMCIFSLVVWRDVASMAGHKEGFALEHHGTWYTSCPCIPSWLRDVNLFLWLILRLICTVHSFCNYTLSTSRAAHVRTRINNMWWSKLPPNFPSPPGT